MTMARKYYTLLIRRDQRWEIHFGDWDKATVDQERADQHEGSDETKMKDMKIIDTDGKQASIDARVAQLNAGVAVKSKPVEKKQPTIPQQTHRDVFDLPNKDTVVACRARYIGEMDSLGYQNAPTWLVYGDDWDTCGSIIMVFKGKTNRTRFLAFSHGEPKGEYKAMTAAILATLDDDSKKSFLGGVEYGGDDYMEVMAP